MQCKLACPKSSRNARQGKRNNTFTEGKNFAHYLSFGDIHFPVNVRRREVAYFCADYFQVSKRKSVISFWPVLMALHLVITGEILVIFLSRVLWLLLLSPQMTRTLGEQWWRSGESPRLPPMWAGFDSRTRRPMWAEFALVLGPAPSVFLRVIRFSSLSKNRHAAYSSWLWLCSKVMHGPYSGCQKAPIHAFGPTLSSCVLAVLARAINETVTKVRVKQ